MSIQALAVLLISWVVPPHSNREESPDDLPLWEKHPAEQRYLRDRARQDAQTWSKIPRGW